MLEPPFKLWVTVQKNEFSLNSLISLMEAFDSSLIKQFSCVWWIPQKLDDFWWFCSRKLVRIAYFSDHRRIWTGNLLHAMQLLKRWGGLVYQNLLPYERGSLHKLAFHNFEVKSKITWCHAQYLLRVTNFSGHSRDFDLTNSDYNTIKVSISFGVKMVS